MDFDFKVVGFSLTNCGPFRQTEEMPIDELFTFVIGKNNTGKSWVLRGLAMRDVKPHLRLHQQAVVTSLTLQADREKALACLRVNDGETLSALWPTPANTSGSGQREASMKYWRFLNESSTPLEVKAKFQPTKIVIELTPGGYRSTGTVSRSNAPLHEILEQEAKDARNAFRYFDFRATNFEVTQDSGDRTLQPSGSNLPTALSAQYQHNGKKYESFMRLVIRVLPELAWVTPTTSNNEAKLSARFEIPVETSDDTLIPLADCGAGVGHVLAILYAAFYERNKIILIDEPQAYLHPSACRELIKVLRELRPNGHQYVIATHSTAILSEGLPATVIQVEREGDSSTLRASPRSTYSDAINDLAVVGARWSDVFVSDEIVWVEGETEADCLPFIMLHFFDATGISFLPLRSTSDFQKSDPAKFAVTIYCKIASRLSLATPKCRVFLDTENLSAPQQLQRKDDVGSSLEFFPFAMYEQQLIHAEAITHAIMEDFSSDPTIDRANILAAVTKYLAENSTDQVQNWAKLLNDLFNKVTEARVPYDKRRHGLSMTKYLLEHDDSKFHDLRDFLIAEFGLKPVR